MARDTALECVTSLESTVEQVTAERDTAQARVEVLESERRQGAGAAARAFIETVQDDELEPSKIRAAVRAAERRLMGALRPLVALLARKAHFDQAPQVLAVLGALEAQNAAAVHASCRGFAPSDASRAPPQVEYMVSIGRR